MIINSALAALVIAFSNAAMASPGNTTVDFSNGVAGWVNLAYHNGVGSWIEPTGGTDGGADWRTINPDTWGLTWSNKTNTAFIGDYTTASSIQIGIDVKVNSIQFQGAQVSRELTVELRDYDRPTSSSRYTSLWLDLGTIAASQGWQHLSATISDTSVSGLPSGWSFYDGSGHVPALSFTNFLKGVDEIAFSTLVPDNFYGYAAFDVTVDNISVTAVPEPSTWMLWCAALAIAGVFGKGRVKDASSD